MFVLLGLAMLACGEAQAFYNPSTGKWLSRDPINELGHETLQATEMMQSNFLDEKNPYVFVRNSAPNLYDKDGQLAGYIIVAIAGCASKGRLLLILFQAIAARR